MNDSKLGIYPILSYPLSKTSLPAQARHSLPCQVSARSATPAGPPAGTTPSSLSAQSSWPDSLVGSTWFDLAAEGEREWLKNIQVTTAVHCAALFTVTGGTQVSGDRRNGGRGKHTSVLPLPDRARSAPRPLSSSSAPSPSACCQRRTEHQRSCCQLRQAQRRGMSRMEQNR